MWSSAAGASRRRQTGRMYIPRRRRRGHDPTNPPFETLPRLPSLSGHGNGALLQGAIPGRQYLSPGHGHPLILEVKGDFCGKVQEILARHGRADDYVEISLDSEYRYNPLHNDLDAYALAYNIASLPNNLFGRGKEPFWQQAYTNLVKFIILLHKVAFDYVTLFDVYECAINPELLESK